MFTAFKIRSFRYQWSADLLTSWAFEMETLILAWFVLVETDSAFLVAALSSLHFGGTLLSPFFGVVADRISRRTMIIAMRCGYGILSLALSAIALAGEVHPWQLFVIAGLSGLIRPSDIVLRNAVIGDTVPESQLRNALGLSRTTMDSARMFGAFAGASLFGTLGLGVAYGVVAGFYAAAVLSSFGIARGARTRASGSNPFQELIAGIRYMRDSREIVGIMVLALLVNFAAFPISHGLLPILARNSFGSDELGLARLVASFAVGALFGSLLIAALQRATRPGRTMMLFVLIWFVLLFGLGFARTELQAIALLILIGCAQSLAMTSMSVLLLALVEPEFRGRLLGVRILAVYGLPIGLLLMGALTEWGSVRWTIWIFAGCGLVLTLLIVARWRMLLSKY